MIDYTTIVVLCEDRQQEVFARQFLESCGVDRHRIYPDVCPKGKRAGEQFVRTQYPKQVVSYRKISRRLTAGLVVLTDADVKEVSDRLRQLESALEQNGVSKRRLEERIGVFIPKRNIETWIYYLMGRAVNEEDVYPYLKQESDCKSYVQALARNRREPLLEIAPPSLKTACQELPHIFPEDA